MRIRRKKWAEDELKNSVLYIDRTEDTKNKWKNIFDIDNNKKNKNDFEIHIEIGMGKGKFVSSLFKEYTNNKRYSNTYIIGIDMIEAMLGLAKREIENSILDISKEERESIIKKRDGSYTNIELKEKVENINNIDNFKKIRILNANAENIDKYFGKEDNITRIYLNFSNPWPKDKHKKRRLTHITKLKKNLEFLSGKKEIYFKTDDYNFFEESREYFKEIGFKEEIITHNLQNDDIYLKKAGIKNIITEHEKMFLDKGIFINAGIFVYNNSKDKNECK